MTPAKDEVLAHLADQANVAQFLSVDPSGELRFVRLRDLPPGQRFAGAADAIDALLSRASYGTVNLRSFRFGGSSEVSKSRPFVYGIATVDEALGLLRRNGDEGLHTIVNETIRVDDGGVSGVALGGIVEFSPDDTPRCVEKPGTVALPQDDALDLLETVYRFRPEIAPAADQRLEWSIHPRRVGLRHTHTLVWEIEQMPAYSAEALLQWPNNFSRIIGDKVFGLLVAEMLGGTVPRTIVVSRRIAPFELGRRTGIAERWLRTAPAEPVPGHYPTTFGWQDPFALLSQADVTGAVAAVMAQDAVDARFSGALLPAKDEGFVIEGVRGRGDRFMLGEVPPESLPAEIIDAVTDVALGFVRSLGPVRIEWAVDESGPWILQLQQGLPVSGHLTIVEGEAERWHRFDPAAGLDALRDLLSELEGTSAGVMLAGGVGITSHFGDLLRRAGVPSRLEVVPPASNLDRSAEG